MNLFSRKSARMRCLTAAVLVLAGTTIAYAYVYSSEAHRARRGPL